MTNITNIDSLNMILKKSAKNSENENKTLSSTISYNKDIINKIEDDHITTKREVLSLLNSYQVIEVSENFQGTFSELLKKYNINLNQDNYLIDIVLVGGGSSPAFPGDPSYHFGSTTYDAKSFLWFSTEGRYSGECKMIKNYIINSETPTQIKIGIGGASDNLEFDGYYHMGKGTAEMNEKYKPLQYRPGTDTQFNQFFACGGKKENATSVYHNQKSKSSDLDSYTGVGSQIFLPQMENNFNYLPHNFNKVGMCKSNIVSYYNTNGKCHLETVVDDDYKQNFSLHPMLWTENEKKEYKELSQKPQSANLDFYLGSERIISTRTYLANIFHEYSRLSGEGKCWQRCAFPKISGKDCTSLGGIGNIGLYIEAVGGCYRETRDGPTFWDLYCYRSRIGAGGPGGCYIYIKR